MPVHIVVQAGITGRIGANQIVSAREDVRQNDPLAHHLHADLPVADPAVVFVQDARSLRDQHELAVDRVIDRLRHLGDHITRQVLPNARDKRTSNHRSGHDLIPLRRQCQGPGITGFGKA